jgi:hypothetical protein
MMRLLGTLTVLLLAVSVVLISGIHVLTRRGTPLRVAALLPDRGCEAPCWQGLRPGQMRPPVLHAWLEDPPDGWRVEAFRARGTPPGFNSWHISLSHTDAFYMTVVRINDPAVERLMLFQDHLAAGDILAALGAPDFVDFQLKPGAHGREHWEIRLFYTLSRLIVVGAVPFEHSGLSAASPIESLRYETAPWDRPADALDWRGFGRIARYSAQASAP